MLTATPMFDKVVIKLHEEEKTTKTGIFIAASQSATTTTRGTVLSVGTGHKLENGKIIPLTVSVGDVVVFAKDKGHKVSVNEEECLVLSENDIFFIEEEE